MNKYVLGIDLGTSGCKVVLVDEKLQILSSSLKEYPIDTPKPGWYEQDPEIWWISVKKGIKKVLKNLDNKNTILGIGLTGQMHGLVAIGKDFKVIRPSIIWADIRNADQCKEIYEKVGGEKSLLKLTNNKMLTGYTGGKILWMMQNEPELFEKVLCILNPKDYIRLRLTGEIATDVSDASGTGLFDIQNRKWCLQLIDKIGIPNSILPRVYESEDISGSILDCISEELDLPRALPVVGGGGDAVVQTIGTGVTLPGVFGTIIGTGGIVATTLDNFFINSNGNLQIFCSCIRNKWHAMGVMLSAGGALKWFSEIFCNAENEISGLCKKNVYKILDDEAFNVSPGAEGLFFLPFLLGQRCPYSDSFSKAAFIGITPRHDKRHFIRSLMEGVVFSLKDMSDLIVAMGVKINQLRTSGGGSSSELWRQIQADVFNAEVLTMQGAYDGGALGAAMIAGSGIGLWNNIIEASSLLNIDTHNSPSFENYQKYKILESLYKKIYPSLKKIFEKINIINV